MPGHSFGRVWNNHRSPENSATVLITLETRP
jgi:hypothetical protein